MHTTIFHGFILLLYPERVKFSLGELVGQRTSLSVTLTGYVSAKSMQGLASK